jgi:hypothetical protein
VLALALANDKLYAGGQFTSISGQARNRIAALDSITGLATAWNPDADNGVYSLAASTSTVYAGGEFRSVDGRVHQGIAVFEP